MKRTRREVNGPAVRALREAYGIPQYKFAETIGVSAGHLSYVEAGERTVSPARLKAIADALGVEIAAISYVPAEGVHA